MGKRQWWWWFHVSDFIHCGRAHWPLLNHRPDEPSVDINQILCASQCCLGRTWSWSLEVALLLLHHFHWCASHSSCGWGCIRGLAVTLYGCISPAGQCLQNSAAMWENSWNSGCMQYWVVGANSSHPAEVGRTVISASADEVVFEVLLKNTYLKQPVLEPELLKIYANNF